MATSKHLRAQRETPMHGSSDTEFTGERGLVTGGTRGIGDAPAHRLRGEGATVVTTARSTSHDLLQPERFVAADLSTAAGAERVARAVRERLGGLDMLVHNVGGSSAPRAASRAQLIQSRTTHVNPVQ